MALRRRGKFSYGDGPADTREELARYSRANGYPATHFADAACRHCGGTVFQVLLDDEAGVAVRVCRGCADRHIIGDGADYLAEATLEECACPCGGESFEATAGVSLYDGNADVRWFYLGLRCVACGLTACYGDWKCEYPGYADLLRRV